MLLSNGFNTSCADQACTKEAKAQRRRRKVKTVAVLARRQSQHSVRLSGATALLRLCANEICSINAARPAAHACVRRVQPFGSRGAVAELKNCSTLYQPTSSLAEAPGTPQAPPEAHLGEQSALGSRAPAGSRWIAMCCPEMPLVQPREDCRAMPRGGAQHSSLRSRRLAHLSTLFDGLSTSHEHLIPHIALQQAGRPLRLLTCCCPSRPRPTSQHGWGWLAAPRIVGQGAGQRRRHQDARRHLFAWQSCGEAQAVRGSCRACALVGYGHSRSKCRMVVGGARGEAAGAAAPQPNRTACAFVLRRPPAGRYGTWWRARAAANLAAARRSLALMDGTWRAHGSRLSRGPRRSRTPSASPSRSAPSRRPSWSAAGRGRSMCGPNGRRPREGQMGCHRQTCSKSCAGRCVVDIGAGGGPPLARSVKCHQQFRIPPGQEVTFA